MKAVLIGAGRWGKILLRSGMNVGMTFECVVDPDPHVCRLLEKEGLQTHHDLSVLDSLDCEAALIAVPPPQHADLIRVCLEHGLHVFCEKPLVMSLTELEILDFQNDAIVQGGYQYALMPFWAGLHVSGAGVKQVRAFWYNDGQVRSDINGHLNTLVHPASVLVSLFWDVWVGIEDVKLNLTHLPGQEKAGLCTITGIVELDDGRVHYVLDTSWDSRRKVREFSVVSNGIEHVYDDVRKRLLTYSGVDLFCVRHMNMKKTPVEHELAVFVTAVKDNKPLFHEPLFTRRVMEVLAVDS